MADETTAIAGELARAEVALRSFAHGPAQRAADDVAAAFERAGVRMARAMGQAAQGGEGALRGMVKVALEELARVAIDRVSAGASRTPAPTHQEQTARDNAGVTVNFHFAAGAQSGEVRKHDAQIAAMVARAVAYGRRNL